MQYETKRTLSEILKIWDSVPIFLDEVRIAKRLTGFKTQFISDTSRPSRPGEIHGKDYFFENREQVSSGQEIYICCIKAHEQAVILKNPPKILRGFQNFPE